MKIDFSQVLKNLKGEPIKDPVERKDDLTLRDVSCMALESGVEGERLDFKEKRRLNRLAERIWNAQEPLDIKAEDITTLKERIAKIYLGNLIPGQACDMLDPEEPEK